VKLYPRRIIIATAIIAFYAMPLSASAQLPPAATEPRVDNASIQQWFEELADPDPAARQQARVNLMGLRRSDLPALRELVERSRPLAPSQAAALQPIVSHIYLSEETYPTRAGAAGFLGVTPAQGRMDHWSDVDPDFSHQQTGAVVLDRLPGFVGYRMLLDGDVIVGIVERPNLRIRGPTDLIQSIAGHRAGETIHLRIVRGMQVLDVPVTLDTRYDDNILRNEQFIRDREHVAHEYWQEHFAPLLADGMS
jgi:hypothetical protein